VKTVLLLAGTAEARALAAAFEHPNARIIASLAGVTARPVPYPCATRTGGFGGVEGLRAYLVREGVDALVDVTHPFATQMSGHAVAASSAACIPLLRLIRPPWPHESHWHPFAALRDAVAALPTGARVLATTGRKDIEPWTHRPDIEVLLRSVDPVKTPPPPPYIVTITGRGPFSCEEEIALMRAHRITHLVTRNSGGDSRARLDAAATLALPVHIIERPPQSAVNVVHTVADALHWISDALGD